MAKATYSFAEGRWVWSPGMYVLLGLRDDGTDPYTLIFERMHASDRARIERTVADAVERPGPFAGQYRMFDSSGRERSIAFVGDVEPATGTSERLSAMVFDVSAAARLASTEAVTAATADRAAIEQVKGALMYAYGIDADAAFALLVQLSQARNVKVVLLAARVAALLTPDPASGGERSLLDLLDRAAHEGADAPR